MILDDHPIKTRPSVILQITAGTRKREVVRCVEYGPQMVWWKIDTNAIAQSVDSITKVGRRF